MHDGPRGVSDLLVELGLSELRLGLRAERVGVRGLQLADGGVLDLLLQDELPGLLKQHLRARQLDLLALQRGLGRLPLLHFGLGLRQLPGRVRPQRNDLRHVQQSDGGLRELQFEVSLPGMPEQHLYFSEQHVLDLQLPAARLRHLQLWLSLPDLHHRMDAERGELRSLQCPYPRVLLL